MFFHFSYVVCCVVVIMNKVLMFAGYIAIIFTLLACSNDGTSAGYKAEAEAVCNVFKPENWKDLPKDVEPYEIQKMITKKLSDAISSNEMQEIINTIPKINMDMRYKYYTESVSKLAGETHECPAIKSYLTIS